MRSVARLKIFGQECTAEIWAMANMSLIIHDMGGQIEIGDNFKNHQYPQQGRLRALDCVVTNSVGNQDGSPRPIMKKMNLTVSTIGEGFSDKSSDDWGYAQHNPATGELTSNY